MIKEVEKKYKKSLDTGKDLVAEKEEIIKKIGQNTEKQKTIKTELEEQKKILGTLKNKK